ncbi:hypothetical protein [Desulfogranum japonicum]|uniref:hypothetical protein n=1 Tax=Desulfogranum japonicum TaxID=231447 RepID=UPI00048CA8C5|nr:hypothetical protein [Desulfogranum japonicum]
MIACMVTIMLDGKFISLSREAQEKHVQEHFKYKESSGWYTADNEFAGSTIGDVIAALIDLEDAEINSIGDCMSGFCVTPPKLRDFVRK